MQDNTNFGYLIQDLMGDIKEHLILDTEENLKTKTGYKPMHYN